MRLLVACALTAVLVLAGAAALDVTPANAADGPQRDADSELLRAVVEGCSAGLGASVVRIQGGVWEARCTPNLGVGPAVRVRR